MTPSMNPPLGSPPTLEWVPVGSIGVDPIYQRSTDNEQSQTLIRKIARFWDWHLCQPLALVKREDGSLWAVDGQHRLGAAKLRGDIPHLPCVIARYGNQADEAAAFVALNKQRRPLSPVDLFKAALAAGDPQADDIMRAIRGAQLTLAPHSNYTAWEPGQIFCVPGIQRAWRQHGEKVVRNALVALSCGFHGQVLRYAGLLLEGLYGFYASDDAKAGSFDPDMFVDVLNAGEQAEWVADARKVQVETNLSRAASMTEAMWRAYREAAEFDEDEAEAA
jgi:hypothetical protein